MELFPGLGDIAFKQPPEFTRRILFNLFPGFRDTSPWEEFLNRNLTPPYISSNPEVIHRRLHSAYPQYLILNSDGFTDLVEDQGHHRLISKWARQLASGGRYTGSPSNTALRLLREALGGEDEAAVSAVLTLDMDVPWIDDITIVVQQL
jgi:pyruvate dehydrogenase phosphatase